MQSRVEVYGIEVYRNDVFSDDTGDYFLC